MSKLENDRLYNLLPSVYRIRDASQGEPLRAVLSVIEREFKHIEDDIDSLYENWFIETCDEWVVPYIGDMLGVRNVRPAGSYSFSIRPYVANTLSYRRRKGSAAVLEQLSRDVTGWNARAVEFFQLLSVTAHVKNAILSRGRTLDLRDSNNLELLNSPFENAAHTCQVGRISSNRGKYNIPNIGIFLWRLQNYSVMRTTARSVSEHADGRYTFHPLGLDTPLFNHPRTETSITHLAEEINVPGALRRRLLYDELETRRQALVDNKTPVSVYFDESPVFQIFIDGQVIPSENILICDLGDFLLPGWLSPPQNKKYIHSNADGTKDEQLLPIKVAVDPELGRLAFPDSVIPDKVEVSYSYGFSDDIGGGPYNRQDSVITWYNPLEKQHVTWQKGVTKDSETLDEAKQLVQTLQDAVKEWDQHVASTPFAFGIIAIMDNSTYVEDVVIDIPPDSRLAIVAANWPAMDIEGQKQRIKGQLVPDNLRPHIKGDLSVTTLGNLTKGEFILDGLLIEGKLTVRPGNLGGLHIAHCTLVPGHGGIIVEISSTAGQQNAHLDISIDHSICDSIRLPDTVPGLRIVNSIIDHAAGEAITGAGASVSIQKSTVFGSSSIYSLEAGNSIFTGIISVMRQQEGCMRFSYIPEGSRTPRRYRCQPDRLKPLFTSLRYGSPGYAQLHSRCPVEIQRGADDESEPGVFHDLFQMQRETDLRLSLNEYMRFGMEAGIFYVN